MNSPDGAQAHAGPAQVYLLDRDAGLLCRILGLYAARSLDVQHVEYAYAAQHVMKLSVTVAPDPLDADGRAEALRVLAAKAATLHGVIAAAAQPVPMRAGQLVAHGV